VKRDYPDTLLGRAAAWIDMIGEEHGHPSSLDRGDMAENLAAAERLFEGTLVDLAEAQEIGGLMGGGAAGDVMIAGNISASDLAQMFSGVCVAGMALGARVQAGLHQ
jgi:hypothetical protein